MPLPPLWDHQVSAVEKAKTKDWLPILFDPGCGKTRTTIEIVRARVPSQKMGEWPTLIVCPIIVIENWYRELVQYAPEMEPFLIRYTQKATAERKKKQILEAMATGQSVLVVNYEFVAANEEWLIKTFKPKILICDESHKAKSHQALRTKALVKISSRCQLRYILTGTLVTNNLQDIFSQYLICDHGQTFGKKYTDFRNLYFSDRNADMPRHCYFPDWQPRPGAAQLIGKLVEATAAKARKEDCLSLPPLVRQTVYLTLPPNQNKCYRMMEDESLLILSEASTSAPDMALTQGLRLQQIASGFVRDDQGLDYELTENVKLDAVMEVLDTIPKDKKVIIWTLFRWDIQKIAQAMLAANIGHVTVTGDMNTTARQANIDKFNDKNSHARVLLATSSSCGIGINLVGASYAIFYSRGYSLEIDTQAEARNYRGGSEIHDKVTRIDLVVKDTIDEVIHTALKNKADMASTVMQYLNGKANKCHLN